MGKTEWEVQWWRDMKAQQEELNKKAQIEQERAGDWERSSRVWWAWCLIEQG